MFALISRITDIPLTRNVWEIPAPQTCSHVRPVHPDSRVFITKKSELELPPPLSYLPSHLLLMWMHLCPS